LSQVLSSLRFTLYLILGVDFWYVDKITSKNICFFARELIPSLVNQARNCVTNSWLVFGRRDKD